MPIKRIFTIKNRILKKWNSDDSLSSIFKNMIILTSGTFIARIISVITVPIITRIYIPEDFGVLAVFTAVTSLIVPLGTFRYCMAIPLPRSNGIATNITMLSLYLLFALSLLTLFLFIFFSAVFFPLLGMDVLVPYWWLFPIFLMGAGVYEIFSFWVIREKAYKALAKTKVLQITIGHFVKIGLGLIGLKPIGLLLGHIITQAGGIISLLRVFYQKIKDNQKAVTLKRMKFVLRYYVDFPMYRMPSQFFLALAVKAPLLFFAWNYSAELTGQIGLAFTVLALPISLFGKTTGLAYYGEIAKIGKKDPVRIQNITINLIKKLFIMSVLPFIILFLFGPWIFSIAFGDIWRDAGVFASILSFYLLAQFVYSPIGNTIFNVLGRQSTVLALNVFRVLLILSVFLLAYILQLNATKTLYIFSAILSIYYYFGLYVVMNVIKKSINKIKY